jgi:hypothetical protein
MSQPNLEIEVNCNDCHGTKLDPHTFLPAGVREICHSCGGTGKKILRVSRFLGPVRVEGVRKVVLTHDSFKSPDKNVDLSGAADYEDFFVNGTMPTT